MGNIGETTIQEVIDNRYKEYAMYTIANRAIPSCIDGFKPVQRKILYAAIHGGKKMKMVELGSISKFNYHHGETSATAAAVGMAQDWNNNLPILEGHGNFGSRLVQESAAPRYIFASLSSNWKKYFTDTVIAPKSSDPDDPEPEHYLPVVPWVLVNGARGIAVGFATEILPRDINDLKSACDDCAKTGKVNPLKHHLTPKFPSFNGSVERGQNPGQWITNGSITNSKALEWTIDELPMGYDREKYINILYKMIDDSKIVSFDDLCDDDGFRFVIKVNRAQNADIAKAGEQTYFKLSKTFTENITTLDEKGKLKIFRTPQALIEHFVKYRLSMFDMKIKYEIERLGNIITEMKQRHEFISHVRAKKIDFMKMNRNDLETYIYENITAKTRPTYFDSIVSTPAVNCTNDELLKLERRISDTNNDIERWKRETPKHYYSNILKGL